MKTNRWNNYKSILTPKNDKVAMTNDIPLKSFEEEDIIFIIAMTVNKSLRQPVKVARIDLSENCFTRQQLFVAWFRMSSPSRFSHH